MGLNLSNLAESAYRITNIRRLARVQGLVMILIGIVFGLTSLQAPHWQGPILMVLLFCDAVVFLQASRWAGSGHPDRATAWMLGCLVVSFPLGELLWSSLTAVSILGVVGLNMLNAAVGFRERRIFRGATASLLGAGLTLGASAVAPFPRLNSMQFSLLNFIIPGIIVFSLVLVLWHIVRTIHLSTLRMRLIVAFMLVVLLPTALITLISVLTNWQNGRAETIRQLETTIRWQEGEIKDWLAQLELDLKSELAHEPDVDRLQALLQPAPGETDQFQTLYAAQLAHFQQSLAIRSTFETLFVLDRDGLVILSTDPSDEQKRYNTADFFLTGLSQVYIQPLQADEATSLLVSRPVFNDQGQAIGVLVGRAGLDSLQQLIQSNADLGQTSDTILVDADQVVLLAEGQSGYQPGETKLLNEELQAVWASNEVGTSLYPNPEGRPVIGSYRWLPELEVLLLAETLQAEAFGAAYRTLSINLAIALVALLLAVAAAILITHTISTPLLELAQTATGIAEGDFALTVEVERTDEIGALAIAFNRMTGRLHELVSDLEERVNRRTRRLETVAALSEKLGVILDLETLLNSIVHEIKDNFGYYHAQIYLLDDQSGQLTLAEGTGRAGTEMKSRGHTISLGAATSLVARAARAGEIVTVANVREAADWLPNPLLPDTYAEMAVPVILGAEGHVVGILDVQENHVGGLDDSDATLLRSLASQIAVAIRNARLFTEVEAALTEAQAAQERYLERSWDREAILQQSRGQSRYSSDRSALPDQAVITAVRRATWSFKQPTLLPLTETDLETEVMANVEARQVLAAPIKLGNTTIGNLQFYAPDRTWSHSELALIEAATDQIAQVAESLRLLKITQERASRERLISEATGRISGVLDFDSLLRVGVAELSQALGGSIETAIRFGSEAELKSAYALVKGSENGTDHSTEYEPLNGSNGHAHED